MTNGIKRPTSQCPDCAEFSGHKIETKYNKGFICDSEDCKMIYFSENA